MANDPLVIKDEVTLEVTKKPKHAVAEEAPVEGVTTAAISEREWVSTDVNTIIIDRPEDWPTQDYVNTPPPRVLWERPYDSI